MLSTSRIVQRQAQKNSLIAVGTVKLQLRYASHSSNPKVSQIARLAANKKLEDRIKNVPIHLLNNSSSPAPTPLFSTLDQPGSIMSGLEKSFSARILADSNNNGGNSDDSSKPVKSPPKSENEDKKSNFEDKENDSKPRSKSKNDPVSEELEPNTNEPARKSSRSPKSKSSKIATESPKSPASIFPPNPSNPEAQTNNTDRFFTVASASEKKQVLILPINRRPLIPGTLKCIL